MNDRIMQYILEVGTDCSGKWMSLSQAEKFAELIVQECIDEIKHLRMNYDTHQDVEPEENDWYIDAFLQAEVRLKEHFGVE
jgi:hypothetical protein